MEGSHQQQIQTLKARWEKYISLTSVPVEEASPALQQEQQESLEDFLHLLVAMSNSKGIDKEDLLNFSTDIHSAFNILARKLMFDIQVQASTPEATREEETCGLSLHMKYLMYDTGWLLLNALCTLSRQALSCKDEFILLIIALFEECLNSCGYDKQPLDTLSGRISSLQKIFVTKKCRRSSSMSSDETGFMNMHASIGSLRDMPDKRFPKGNSSVLRLSRSKSLPSQNLVRDSSDSENEHRKSRPRRRSRVEVSEFHRCDRLPFTSAFPVYLFQCANQIVQRHVHTSGIYVLRDSTSVLDLSVTLLSLLEGLCASEVMHLASKNALSQFLAPYLTKFLSDLQQLGCTDDSTMQTNVFSSNLNTLQRLVLRLLLKLCLSNGINHQKVAMLTKTGTISSLLTLAIDINRKLSVFVPPEKRPVQVALRLPSMEEEKELTDVFEEDELESTLSVPDKFQGSLEGDLTLVSEVLEGILMILSTILYRCQDDQTVISQAVAMLWEFEVTDGFAILQETILQLDMMLHRETCNLGTKENAKECINDLTCGLRKLVIAAKRAKLEYLHKFHCLKRNHQYCDYTCYMHHHHSLLGIPSNKVREIANPQVRIPNSPTEKSASQRKCCLVRSVELCLCLLEKAHCSWTVSRILSCIDQSGVCCCLPEEVFINGILKQLPDWPISLSTYALKIVAKVTLEQLGGGNMEKKHTVDLCDQCKVNRTNKLRIMTGDDHSKSDKSRTHVVNKPSLWTAVESYRNLLIGKNPSLSTLVAKHLTFLVRHGSRELKQALYNRVYIPVFEHVNSLVDDPFDAEPDDKVPDAALQYCYCALPSLLKFNSAEDLFLLQMGLPHALHLIKIEASRAHILKIFEVMLSLSQKQAEKRAKTRKRARTNDSGLSAGTYPTSDFQSSSDEKSSSITDKAVIQLFFDIITQLSPWKGIGIKDNQTEVSPRVSQYSSQSDTDEKLKSYVWVSSPKDEYVSQSIESAFSSFQVDTPISPMYANGSSIGSHASEDTSLTNGRRSSTDMGADYRMDETQLPLCASVWKTCSNIVSFSSIFTETFKQRLETKNVVQFLDICLAGFVDSVGVLKRTLGTGFREDVSSQKEAAHGRMMTSLGLVEAVLRVLLNLKEESVYQEVLVCLKSHLSQPKILDVPDVAQAVVSSLLRVALDQPCEDVSIKNHCVLKQPEDDAEEDTVSTWEDLFDTSDAQSEMSDRWSTEEGYDADSESGQEGADEDTPSSMVGRDDESSQECLVHTRVCATLLEILSVTSSNPSTEAIKLTLHRLLTLSKHSSVNKMSSVNRAELCRYDIVTVILDHYSEILRGLKKSASGVRTLLIELIAVLVEKKITAMQLRRLMQLCETEESLLSDVLKTLLDIAANTSEKPNQYLSFPVTSKSNSSLFYKEDYFKQKSNSSAPSGDVSTTSPLHISLEHILPWPPHHSKGFSLSVWIRIEELPKKAASLKRTKTWSSEGRTSRGKDSSKRSSDSRSGDHIKCRDQVRIFAVGGSNHCLEVWTGFRPSCLVIKLSSDKGVSSEVRCFDIAPVGKWFHLVMSYDETLQSGKLRGVVSLAVNGHLPRHISLETTDRSLTKSSQHAWLFIGQSSEVDQERLGVVHIGNVLMFNDCSTLNEEMAFHLFTMGPNYFSLNVCDGTKPKPLYSRHVSHEYLQSNLEAEFLNGKREAESKQFQETLILGYSPNKDHLCNIFRRSLSQGNTLTRVLPGMSTPKEGAFLSPDIISSYTSCRILPVASHHLVKAIHEIGGISVFLYFLGKVVESSSNPEHQADAVKLLMILQESSYSLALEFRAMSGPAMLCKVLTSSKFHVGPKLLKVLLDGCCSPPLIYYCTLKNTYKVHQQTHSILQDEDIFTQLVLNWRIWQKGDPSVFCLLLDAIQMLIKRDHPQRRFNFEKLQNIGLVEKLLIMCKERHDDDLAAVPPTAMGGLIKLIRTLLGLPSDPADPHLMAEICDFLLATHPAVNTFVCHAPSSFYFKQHKFASSEIKSGRNRTRTQSSEQSESKEVQDDVDEVMNSDSKLGAEIEGSLEENICQESDLVGEEQGDTTISEDLPNEGSLSKGDKKTSETDLNLGESDFFILATGDVSSPGSLVNQDISSFSSFGASEKNPSLNKLSSSLLDLLSDAIMSQTEFNLEKILGIVIKLDTLVVLAHHTSLDIRTSVVKLIHVYFHVAPDAHIESYMKKKFFHLLANQLYQNPASKELVEACLMLTFGTPTGLDDRLDFSDITTPDNFSRMSTVLLLSLLERCLHDPILCSKTLCIVLHLFEGIPVMVPTLLENGFIETVVNVLASTSALCSDSTCPQELDLLVENIQHVLASIANKVFYINKPELYQHFEDMMLLLGGLEERFRNKYGTDSLETEIILETQSYIFREVLEYFRTITMAADSSIGKKKILMVLNRTKSYAGEYTESSYYEGEQKYEQFKWQQQVGAPPPEGVIVKRRSFSDHGAGLEKPEYRSDVKTTAFQHRSLSVASTESYERRFSAEVDNLLRNQRLRNDNPIGMGLVNEQELTRRFQKLCLFAVSLITQRDPEMLAKLGFDESPDSFSTSLAKELFFLLSEALAATLEKKLGRSKQFESIAWASKETLRVQLAHLLCHMMSPSQDISLRVYTLQVAHIPKGKELLKSLLSVHAQASKFELFLFDLLVNQKNELSDNDMTFGLMLVELLKDSGFKGYNPIKCNKEILDAAKEELKEAKEKERLARESYQNQRMELAEGVSNKMADLETEVVGLAMKTTQVVAANQNTLRVKFLDHVRAQISTTLDVRTAWQNLTQQVTHERAIWHQPNNYSSSWQLDPTEGPGRVRKRLQRCHLNISERFFLPEYQKKHENVLCQPLTYILEDNASSSSELKRRLQMNEKISRASPCTQVAPGSESTGDLLLGENDMYFVYEETTDDMGQVQNRDVSTISWQYDDIKELHKRWYQLRDNAMEIFLINGHTLLLAFENTEERNTMYSLMKQRELPNLLELDDISTITRAWCGRQMTNFEYLMQLNKLSGRSFNDLMQYPVFPFILAEYTTNELDLNSHDIYRDLSKPVAVQLKEMEERYKRNYQCLKEEYERELGQEESTLTMKPYHYGSHYSNSGITLQYLVRLPPFTDMFLQYQDNNFDLPDRTFHSIDTCWKLSSFQSTSDVKELIPEFFFLPEFLENFEGYNFGKKQNGEHVNHVVLPPWAKDNPYLFIEIHKQALESPHVSHHLHAWIDLVFGFKQTGQAAIDAISVYHPATYFGTDIFAIADPVRRKAVETMIKTYGQTPRQLFTAPHPTGQEPDTIPITVSAASSALISQFTNKAPGGKPGIMISIEPSREPLRHIRGMQWGSYVGSLAASEPMVKWQQGYSTPPASLVGLPTGSVCALSKDQCLLVMYGKERGINSMQVVNIKWSGVLSWGYPDGVLRLKHKAKQSPINLIQTDAYHEVTCCTSLSDSRLLFVACSSGVILAYRTKYNPDKPSGLEIQDSMVSLYGHTGSVTAIRVCRPYSILVSASQDGSCIIWDLNRLCYVRSLVDKSGPISSVTTVEVSDVSGDIASVSNIDEVSSELTLWTVNARVIGRVTCESIINCLAFSLNPAGISVNSVVAGCEDGTIRFWSCLDMSPVRMIHGEDRPVVSLTFTHDSNFLFASDAKGLVVAWGKKDHKSKAPRLEAFLSSS